jgi:glycosyltransferase involved in cell wall biosynthesis
MTLTIVTDHRFFLYDSKVYDDYVFNYDFFKTFLNVFEEIKIVARIKEISEISEKYLLSSGDNITFIPLKDVHGLKWLLFSSYYVKQFRIEIMDTDGFYFVLPSFASWQVYKINKNRIPFMFHSIGDPEDSMIPSRVNFFKKLIYAFIGKTLKYKKKKIIQDASIGSYVSFCHLQKKFPVKQDVYTDSISSIRLNSCNILDVKRNFSESACKIVHIGSFIPLKNQKDLIYCLDILLNINVNAELHLVGSGSLIEECKRLTNQLGIIDKVFFYGQVTGFNKIVKILDNCDFFILPSSNEGMPRAMIEAMSRGLICFGSNVGGISELLKKEYTFKPGNINEMILVICRVLSIKNKEDYQVMSRLNIKISERFTKEKLEIKREKLLLKFKKIINENNI